MDAPVSMPPMFGVPLIVPVLMAGGVGSRLWPLSRELHPKQFLSLLGSNSLLQDAALRSAQIDQAMSPVVVGAEAHRYLILDQLQRAGVRGATLILEPEGRNTAPAAAVAAQYIAEAYGPEAVVFLMPADHAIRDQARYVEAVQAAAEAAAQGYIVTFGIKPTRAETGFGYLKAGARLGTLGAFDVEAFVEKPAADKAREFVAAGDHYWNGGMFLFRSGRYLAELRRLEPEMYHHAMDALAQARREGPVISLDARAFCACRSDSIDYAVMEKTEELALVPLDADWDDVGAWSFYDKLPASDDAGNRTRGDVVLEAAQDNVVHAESRLVAMLGVSDHVVVETEDAVLVAAKDRLQDVKALVQQLKRSGRSEALTHRRVYRPWGYYETIGFGERFQVKHISVNPGEKLSLQMHYHRAEHWVVVHGTARVTCSDRCFILTEDQSTYIPLGNTHRLENPGKVPLELIEVQSGTYLGEDDIVRFSDVYGRSESAEASPVTAAATA